MRFDLPSAQALFAMTLAVTLAGQDYLIESIASNEAFGQVYLYRLLLREACCNHLAKHSLLSMHAGDPADRNYHCGSEDSIRKGIRKSEFATGHLLYSLFLFPIPCTYAKRERLVLSDASHASRRD